MRAAVGKEDEMALHDMYDQRSVPLEFTVFLLNRLARFWGKTTPDTYGILKKTGALDEYILPNWEVLHSEGTEALLGDVTGYVRGRGVAL